MKHGAGLWLRWAALAVSMLFAAVTGSNAMAHPDFDSFDARARAGEKLNVVFFGGSLTWGAQATDPQLTSYRARMAEHLEELYPKAHFHYFDASVGGTGSQLGAFRLQRDVLARRPDFVFLDFTVNDGAYDPPDPDRLASYESLVRRMVSAGIPVEQVIFPLKRDLQANPPARSLDAKHKEIAQAYHLPVADIVAFMRQLVAAGKADPDKLWTIAEDPTHPGDEAYAFYAEAAFATYRKAVAEHIRETVPAKMLNADTYMTVKRAALIDLGPLPSGWTRGLPNRIAVTYDFLPSRWLDSVVMATATPQPAPLHFAIKARDIFLFGEGGPKSGSYQVTIDGGVPKTFSPANKDGNMRYFESLATGLDPAQSHEVVITPQLTGGQELRLESVCIAGAPSTVFSRL